MIDFTKLIVGAAKPCDEAESLASTQVSSPTIFSEDQQAALELVSKYRLVFLTGPAGTGKSFVVRELKRRYRTMVCASTGIAASLIGGRTLHSLLGIGPHSVNVNLGNFLNKIDGYEMLIVDEVSMVNAAIFTQLMLCVKATSLKLVLVGDFLQLPPVEGGFAFESDFWTPEIQKYELKVNHRQDDPEYFELLSLIRKGKITPAVYDFVKSRQCEVYDEAKPILSSKRDSVAFYNAQKLAKLQGESKKFPMQLTGNRTSNVSPRFPEVLEIKQKARVMMLTNTDDWVNGSLGYIDGWSTIPDEIRVCLDNGHHVKVQRATDNVLDGNGKVKYSISQFPMMLAWSCTLHKAQGATLDAVAINMANHFAPGQTYVGMSRCKFRNKLDLHGNDFRPFVDKKALRFMEA